MEKTKALLVDDDPDMLNILDAAIRGTGFDTILARDGEEGWKQFMEHRPPLVISDIYMPKMNGIILLEDIKRESYETIVILITGYTEYQELISDASFPPDAFLSKPFSLSDLINKIESTYGRLPRDQ